MCKASTPIASIDENNEEDDEESISEILEQCIKNAEDVESEFVREESGFKTSFIDESVHLASMAACRT